MLLKLSKFMTFLSHIICPMIYMRMLECCIRTSKALRPTKCLRFLLKNLSMNELINEPEYGDSIKKFVFDQLVMSEYYQKQQ